MYLIVGGVGNGAAEEDRCWDLNPGVAAIPPRGPRGPEGKGGGPHGFGREGREDHVALAEWGPLGSNTADGARSLNHGLLLLFLRYGTRTLQREKEGLCVSVGILKDFSILMKTLSHYSESV